MKKCILEIRDEVNVRFRDVDPTTRRKMKAATNWADGINNIAKRKAGRVAPTTTCSNAYRSTSNEYLSLLDTLSSSYRSFF